MARKSKEFKPLERKRVKRKGRHTKTLNKSKRLIQKKKYRGQGK